MTDLVRRQSARLSEDWLKIGLSRMLFRARCGRCIDVRAIERRAIQTLILDFDFFFSRRFFIQACARGVLVANSRFGCESRLYQKPSRGTAVAFAEIAEIFRTAFAVPQPAVCGTGASKEKQSP
jgi:hypothetical protein